MCVYALYKIHFKSIYVKIHLYTDKCTLYIYIYIYIYIHTRGAYDKFPDFFRMGI